jgi:hypothetical protein
LELVYKEKGRTLNEIPNEFLDSAKDSDNSHSCAVPINVCGSWPATGCKYVRVDHRCNQKTLFKLLCDDNGGKKPSLIMSIFGGAKYFSMVEPLEKEFIRGIIEAAKSSSK